MKTNLLVTGNSRRVAKKAKPVEIMLKAGYHTTVISVVLHINMYAMCAVIAGKVQQKRQQANLLQALKHSSTLVVCSDFFAFLYSASALFVTAWAYVVAKWQVVQVFPVTKSSSQPSCTLDSSPGRPSTRAFIDSSSTDTDIHFHSNLVLHLIRLLGHINTESTFPTTVRLCCPLSFSLVRLLFS